MGVVHELQRVTDHPKVNIDQAEYERIQNSMMYYRGDFPSIKFRNSNGDTKHRPFSTINMLKKVANQYSTVVFNEQCEITVDGSATEFIDTVFSHNDFKRNLSKYLESMFGLGGLTVRPYYNNDSEQIELAWALADAFYPLNSNTNVIDEGCISFVTTKIEDKKVIYYTLLEFHEWVGDNYVITNELYRSETVGVVGTKVDLSMLYDGLEESVEIQSLTRPLFAYVKPAGFNNINPYSPLGLGICDNCKDTLDRINKTYDEFDQEIRLGKRRVAVSENLLKSRIDENGRVVLYFDDSETIYQKIPAAGMDDWTIEDLTKDIRTEQYTSAINHHLRTLEMETGLSGGTFTFDTNGVRSTKTATEIVSENSQTYQSRSMQVTEIERFIKELIISICELGQASGVYSGPTPTFEDIGIDFQDGAFQDKDGLVNYYLKLYNAGLIPGQMVLENVLELPQEEAASLYKEALMNVATKTSGMFTDQGLPTDME